jgi:hypothetical protein
LERKNEQEVLEVEQQFSKNKASVIDYLFENVINVDIHIPEVVKGKFEERLTNQN